MTCPDCPTMTLELCEGGEEYVCPWCRCRYVFDPVSGKVLLKSHPMPHQDVSGVPIDGP